MKVLVRSPFSQFSGYGRDGIGLVRGLLDLRHDVRLGPLSIDVPLPRDIAGLLTAPQDAPFDVALHHMPLKDSSLSRAEAERSRRNVLWTTWNFFDVPDRTSLDNYDHVVVYDDRSCDALKDYVEPNRLLKVIGGYEADDWKLPEEPPRKRSDHFIFGMVGRPLQSVGVYAAHRAFQLLKERHGEGFHAKLILHSTDPFPLDAAPDVHVIEHRALPEELRDFYWVVDTLLTPPYPEAKHLPAIEALACGTPTILPDTPDHREWATSDMVTWVAEGDEALADAMWQHYTNIGAQRVKAQMAARTLPAMLDWTKCLQRLGRATGLLL